jgi:hypothetical protein
MNTRICYLTLHKLKDTLEITGFNMDDLTLRLLHAKTILAELACHLPSATAAFDSRTTDHGRIETVDRMLSRAQLKRRSTPHLSEVTANSVIQPKL